MAEAAHRQLNARHVIQIQGQAAGSNAALAARQSGVHAGLRARVLAAGPEARTETWHNPTMSDIKTISVRATKCATCPFREGSKYSALAPQLAASALTEASRICHSTGSNNAINRRTGKPASICRGSRDVQLQHFVGIGFIPEPTDEAWAEKWAQCQAKLTIL